MDNKIFNVNGKTKEQLSLALQLFLTDEYGQYESFAGWYFDNQKGLVLTSTTTKDYKAKPFTNSMSEPIALHYTQAVNILWDWLLSEQAKTVTLDGFDKDENHDGSNVQGWRLYTEDWGGISINGQLDNFSMCAIKPVYLWYGK